MHLGANSNILSNVYKFVNHDKHLVLSMISLKISIWFHMITQWKPLVISPLFIKTLKLYLKGHGYDFGEILFFYFYCSQSLYSAFLINQNMSVNRKVTSKIIAYNSLLCKQGSCHVVFFWHWFSKPVKFFLSRFFYLLIYNIANIFLTWINSS